MPQKRLVFLEVSEVLQLTEALRTATSPIGETGWNMLCKCSICSRDEVIGGDVAELLRNSVCVCVAESRSDSPTKTRSILKPKGQTMLNASKTLKFCLAITLIAMGAGVDFSLNMSTQSQSPSSEKNVASRYHLRSRTPNFFSRSKTATTPTPQAAPTQPVVRRG